MTLPTTDVEILAPTGCVLGESPLWHPQRRSCFWVDIEQKRIYEYCFDKKELVHYEFDRRISLIVRGRNDDLIVALQGGIARFELNEQGLTVIEDLGEDWNTHRCNDGICDRKGNLWVGTMALNHGATAGTVYKISPSGLIEKKIPNVTISNGMAWSLDHTRLYYIDSPTREIKAYLYNELTGSLVFEKIVIQVPREFGLPDGMAIDAEGKLWVALYGGYGVGRFDVESGLMIHFLKVPTPNVTNCSFIGDALDHMIITTAKEGMTDGLLNKFPQSGDTFIVKLETSGVPDFISEL